jgi:hypothetical protein
VKKARLLAAAAALAAVAVFVTGPAAPRSTSGFPAIDLKGRQTLRGAFHIHTTRSDGALDKSQVAAAAARAGMQFAIFTDHGDGTRPPDPPAYIDGVLCMDGVEISTNGGHYVALGMAPAPYPLGGEADAVAEDVARLGGFGVAAHPISERGALSWSDWSVPIDGLEWLSADSEWRDESRWRLSRAFVDYLWRPAGALASILDRPVAALARWDVLTARRRVVGLAGHDAHGGIGSESPNAKGRRVHVPSYESSFRTFGVYVTLPTFTTPNPADHADVLIRALREGAVFTAIDAVAAPAALEFRAEAADGITVHSGGIVPDGSDRVRFTVRAAVPAGATITLLRGGTPVAQGDGGALEHTDDRRGAYRVEVSVRGAPGTPSVPWLVSNPIYWFAGPPSDAASPPEAAPIGRVPLASGSWDLEGALSSDSSVTGEGVRGTLTYQLGAGAPASQFAAMVKNIEGLEPATAWLVFRASADRPVRVSVQLRFASRGGARWVRSVYLDQNEREVRVPIDRLKPADSRDPLPPLAEATSILFVADLTNARPGAQGRVTVTDLATGR